MKLGINKNIKIGVAIILPIILLIGVLFYKINIYDKDIENILKTDAYNYLSAAAKDYIGTVTSGSDALVTSGAVHSAIAGLTGFHFEIVQVLPEVGETNVIYLVLKSQSQSGNVYTEYAWINNNWEILGDTAIELEYLTNGEIDTIWNAA